MLAFFNSILSTADMLSGGAQIAVDYLKGRDDLVIVMPEINSELIKKELKATYNLLVSSYDYNNPLLIILNWIRLTILTCKTKVSTDIFTSTDNFCNTIPAYRLKGDKKWTACIFHIIPFKLGRIIPCFLQWLSFVLIKKRADKILVLNELTRMELIKIGFDRNKIEIIPVKIDMKLIENITVGSSIYNACFLGRLSPSKGIYDLPKIWKRLPGKLLIIGGGGFRQDVIKLQELIQEYKLDKYIDMVGTKTGEEKYRLMKSCKIFIFPSYEEGLAISILEAMACKLPVVAWDLPEYRAIYKDVLITVPKGNLDMFVKEIINLLSDEKLRKKCAERSCNFARQFNWDAVAQHTHERIAK